MIVLSISFTTKQLDTIFCKVYPCCYNIWGLCIMCFRLISKQPLFWFCSSEPAENFPERSSETAWAAASQHQWSYGKQQPDETSADREGKTETEATGAASTETTGQESELKQFKIFLRPFGSARASWKNKYSSVCFHQDTEPQTVHLLNECSSKMFTL